MRAPAKLRQESCHFIKKGDRETGGDRGLRTSGDVYDVRNRSGVLIRVSPMLRGLAQLQKVAENDHFCCGVAPTPFQLTVSHMIGFRKVCHGL